MNPIMYKDYLLYRSLGFRAVTSFGMAKYGFWWFLCNVLIDDIDKDK